VQKKIPKGKRIERKGDNDGLCSGVIAGGAAWRSTDLVHPGFSCHGGGELQALSRAVARTVYGREPESTAEILTGSCSNTLQDVGLGAEAILEPKPAAPPALMSVGVAQEADSPKRMFFQDGLTGSAWGDWANYTASPLRAR